MTTNPKSHQSVYRNRKQISQEINIPLKELNNEIVGFMADKKLVYNVLSLFHEHIHDLSKITTQEVIAAKYVLAHYQTTMKMLDGMVKEIQQANSINYDMETEHAKLILSDKNFYNPNKPTKKSKVQKQRERIEFEKTTTGTLIDLTHIPTSYEGAEAVIKQKQATEASERRRIEQETSSYPNLPEDYRGRVDYYLKRLETKVKHFEIVLDSGELKRARSNLSSLKDKTHTLLNDPNQQPTGDLKADTKTYQTYVMDVVAETGGLYDIEPDQFEELLDRLRESIKGAYGLVDSVE